MFALHVRLLWGFFIVSTHVLWHIDLFVSCLWSLHVRYVSWPVSVAFIADKKYRWRLSFLTWIYHNAHYCFSLYCCRWNALHVHSEAHIAHAPLQISISYSILSQNYLLLSYVYGCRASWSFDTPPMFRRDIRFALGRDWVSAAACFAIAILSFHSHMQFIWMWFDWLLVSHRTLIDSY